MFCHPDLSSKHKGCCHCLVMFVSGQRPQLLLHRFEQEIVYGKYLVDETLLTIIGSIYFCSMIR